MISKPKLLLVGCGHLGSAMLRQWLEANAFSATHIVKPSPPNSDFLNKAAISWSPTPNEIPTNYAPDIVILAIRPKDLGAVAPSYAKYRESLFLSLAAGKKLAQLEAFLSPSHSILRAMPNIASEVGTGMTFLTANTYVTTAQKRNGEQLLQAVGAVAWLEDETLFDVATALSGCGPGYVFAMVEALADAGEKLGLSTTLAMQLARQTIIGSGALLASTKTSASDLRKAISSLGTMTEAGLKQLLNDNQLADLMFKTMKAAVERAQELAQ